MKYIEKHVTTHFGEERIDWPAAISIEMFNELHKKIIVLDKLNGIFGPMKKAAKLTCSVKRGDILKLSDIKFIRTKEISDMTQLDVLNSIGKKIKTDLKRGSVLMSKYFI